MKDARRGQDAAAGGEVLALAALSPGRGGSGGITHRADHVTPQKKNTSNATGARAALPFERDAETGSGGLGKVEDAGAVDGDEHLQAESQLHLPQPTGDDQRHEAGGSRHGRVVARAQGV